MWHSVREASGEREGHQDGQKPVQEEDAEQSSGRFRTAGLPLGVGAECRSSGTERSLPGSAADRQSAVRSACRRGVLASGGRPCSGGGYRRIRSSAAHPGDLLTADEPQANETEAMPRPSAAGPPALAPTLFAVSLALLVWAIAVAVTGGFSLALGPCACRHTAFCRPCSPGRWPTSALTASPAPTQRMSGGSCARRCTPSRRWSPLS